MLNTGYALVKLFFSAQFPYQCDMYVALVHDCRILPQVTPRAPR